MKEYKVVEVAKRSMLQKALDANKLEKLLNEQAKDGWIFDKVVSSESQVFSKDMVLIVFYKDV